MLAIISAISSFFGFLKALLGIQQREEDKQAGRNEVIVAIDKKTRETEEAMDKVDRPTDDEVSASLRDKKF